MWKARPDAFFGFRLWVQCNLLTVAGWTSCRVGCGFGTLGPYSVLKETRDQTEPRTRRKERCNWPGAKEIRWNFLNILPPTSVGVTNLSGPSHDTSRSSNSDCHCTSLLALPGFWRVYTASSQHRTEVLLQVHAGYLATKTRTCRMARHLISD